MSSGEQLEQRGRALIAALLWHVPLLRATGEPGAEDFANALSSTPPREFSPNPEAPLSLAAAAWLADVADDGEPSQYWELIANFGNLEKVFAFCLAAASSTPAALDALRQAPDVLESIDEPTVRAHVAMKLACYAHDRQLTPEFMRLLEIAEESSDAESRMGKLVRFERANMLGVAPPESAFGRMPHDELVELPWVDSLALAAGRDHEEKLLLARARDPWSWTFSAGRTAFSMLAAAEKQAAWAGSYWTRREIRKQLGAAILSSNPQQPGLAAYGLTMWLLGGGSTNEQPAVARLVEPVLTTAHIDEILNRLVNLPGPVAWREYTVARIGMAFWDSMSDAMAQSLWETLNPHPTVNPVSDEQRRLTAALGLRFPDKLDATLQAADETTRGLYLASIGPAALEQLSRPTLQALRDDTAALISAEPGDAERWISLGELDTVLGGGEPPPLDDAPSYALAELAGEGAPWTLSDALLASAIRDLSSSVDAAAEQSKVGTVGIGGSISQTLGKAIVDAREIGPEASAAADAALELLTAVACDDEVVGQYRIEALAGLAIAVSAEGLPTDLADRLRAASSQLRASFLMNMSDELFIATRLQALGRQLTEAERAQVAVLTRAEDARVRQAVVSAAGRSLMAGADRERLEDVLVTALYDPETVVMITGLGFLGEVGLSDEALRETAIQRLGQMLGRFPRRVRVQAAGVAGVWNRATADPLLQALLDQAAQDKSWQVRDQAQSFLQGDQQQ